MIKILIADDNAEVRQGLKLLLADHRDFMVVGEATTEEEVMQQLREFDCDILTLDFSISGRNCIEFIRKVKTEKPALPVLVFSMHEERQYATSCLKAGASCYLTKNTDPYDLVAAIRNYVSVK